MLKRHDKERVDLLRQQTNFGIEYHGSASLVVLMEGKFKRRNNYFFVGLLLGLCLITDWVMIWHRKIHQSFAIFSRLLIEVLKKQFY